MAGQKFCRLRIRTADNTGDLATFSSVPGATYPYVATAPTGDGQEWDPLTGRVKLGAYTIGVVDVDTGGGVRAVNQFLTDGSGLQQLVQHHAFIELSPDGSAWTTMVAGYINRAELTTAQRWTFWVGESRLLDEDRPIFDYVSTNFQGVTLLLGQFIKGGWQGVADFKPWLFEVTAKTTGIVTLHYLEGWNMASADNTKLIDGTVSDYTFQRINGAAQPEMTFSAIPSIAGGSGYWAPYIDVVVTDQANNPIGTFQPLFAAISLAAPQPVFFSPTPSPVIPVPNGVIRLLWASSQPNVGDQFRVYAWRRTISAANPLHIQMHPVDICTKLMDDYSMPYDATSAANVKAAIGPDAIAVLRIDSPRTFGEFTGLLGLAYGFGIRFSGGQRQFFASRIRSASPPVASIGINQLYSPSPLIFQLDESTIRNVVRFTSRSFVPWQPGSPISRPGTPDDIFETPLTRLYNFNAIGSTNPATDDWNNYGRAELAVDFPGLFASNAALPGFLNDSISLGFAQSIFQQFARGAQYTELDCTPDVTVSLGDEVLIQLPQMPNANVRGGTRILQVVKRTEQIRGCLLRLLDAGVSAQVGTNPTFTLAQGAFDARKYVDVTITNAAALNAANVPVRVEFGIGTQPAVNGTLYTIFAGGAVPAAFTLPGFDAGSKVYVRMRGESPLLRPGAFTAWQNVQLNALTAPTVLTFTPSGTDPGLISVGWTNGDTDIPVFVWLRQNADPSTYSSIMWKATPGDTSAAIRMVTGVAYAVEVFEREDPPFHGESTHLTGTYTPPGSVSLTAPTNPWGFSLPAIALPPGVVINPMPGTPNPGAFSTIGLQVVATSAGFTSVEFQVATETAPGAGTYGAFTTFATVQAQSVLLDTQASLQVPQKDGLRRQLKARMTNSTRGTVGASAFCATQTVDPNVLVSPRPARTFDVGTPPIPVSAATGLGTGFPKQPLRLPPQFFVPPNPTQTFQLNQTGLIPNSPGSTTYSYYSPVPIPRASTITGVRLRGFRNAAGDACTLTLYRVDDSGSATLIATVTAPSGGYSTTTTTLTEAVGANTYVAVSNLKESTNPGDAALVWAELDYTIPDLTVAT